MSGLPPNRDAVLEWGVRASLLSYMVGSADFAVETTEGATFTPAVGVTLTGRVDAEGVLALQGSVVLRAHGGALTVPLVGVQIDGTTLTIDDPAADEQDGASGRLVLVNLDTVSRGSGERGEDLVFATRLAHDADALFMYNYLPDTAFDPIRIRLISS